MVSSKDGVVTYIRANLLQLLSGLRLGGNLQRRVVITLHSVNLQMSVGTEG